LLTAVLIVGGGALLAMPMLARAGKLTNRRPLLSVDVSVCLSVCLFVRNFDTTYLGN